MRIPHRKGYNSRRNKRSFTRGAMRVHTKNLRAKPMRGGIRL